MPSLLSGDELTDVGVWRRAARGQWGLGSKPPAARGLGDKTPSRRR